jgi:hypothetical protein
VIASHELRHYTYEADLDPIRSTTLEKIMTVRVFPFAATVLVLVTTAACGGSSGTDLTQGVSGATTIESQASLTAGDAGAPCKRGKHDGDRDHKGGHHGKGEKDRGHGSVGGADDDRGEDKPGDDRGHDDDGDHDPDGHKDRDGARKGDGPKGPHGGCPDDDRDDDGASHGQGHHPEGSGPPSGNEVGGGGVVPLK